jgi:hypothetical protein
MVSSLTTIPFFFDGARVEINLCTTIKLLVLQMVIRRLKDKHENRTGKV